MRKTRASAAKGRKPRRDAEYADLFDFAPVTYAMLDSAGMVLNVNHAATRLLNVARKDLIGRPLRAFVSEKDRGELLDHLRRCRLSSRVVESEIRFTNEARGPVICRVYTKRVSYKGHAAYPTVIVDQTERLGLDQARLKAERDKQAAERASELARAGNAAKDRFLAAVSHELRTPLTPALLAASQLSSWDGLSEEARELASTVTRNIQFEAHLIDDLLDVARINRNRIDLDFDAVDVHEVVREAVDVCRPASEGKKQVLSLVLVAEHHHARADRSRLRQVFWNLLNNAIKFTPVSGEVVIRSVNVPDEVLRVSVSDSGEGIDASVLENLFAPFERHPVEHETRGGLGLGLSISKGIVAAHGGQIWAASEGPGQGSTFAVELATVPAEHVEQAKAPGIKEKRHDNAGAPRVLVIEDDQDSRELVRTFLSKYGYEAEAAATFDEAIERLGEPWDVVLADMSLPGGSGLDIARRARQLKRPPSRMIALSGFGSADDRRNSREAGFDDHLVKPLDLETLLTAIGGSRAAPAPHKPVLVKPRAQARVQRG